MEMEDLMFAHTTRFCKAPLLQFYLGKAFGVLKAKAPKGLHSLYEQRLG